jgi:hypothetical protein
MKRILFAAAATLMLVGSTHAAEISCLSGLGSSCAMGRLSGEIVKGDYEKVKSLISSTTSTFWLASPGGDVDEALKIGRLFREYLISTEAPYRDPHGFLTNCRGQNCTCASACAFIWFGGVDRMGTVGLHRPYIDEPVFRGLPPADASMTYRRMLDNVVVYLNEMEVPRSIIETMATTNSGDIRWVNYFDEGLDRPPSIAEWVDASCGKGDPYLEALRQNQKPSLQLDALGRTHFKKLKCQSALFDKHRETPAWRWLSLLLSHLFSTSESAPVSPQTPAPKKWSLYRDRFNRIEYMSERECEWARARELKSAPAGEELLCWVEFDSY